MLLTAAHLAKSYGAYTVLEDGSLVINGGDRVGIVGANGAGKSTLLRLLAGREAPDAGTVACAPSLDIGYLPQATPTLAGGSIADLLHEAVGGLRRLEGQMRTLEAAMAAATGERLAALLDEYGQAATRFQDRGGYALDARIAAVLAGLGLADLAPSRALAALSGGERARIVLAALLLRAPDLLLLDEPTNHLDLASLEWLEGYLAAYPGAAAIVSHDRHFLNRAVTHIVEVDDATHRLKRYTGDYDAFVRAKAGERAQWEDAYARQREEVRELRRRIREAARAAGHNRPPTDNDKTAYKAAGARAQAAVSRTVRSAEEQLRRIGADPVAQPPKPLRFQPRFQATALQSSQIVRAEHLSKGFGDRVVLRDLSFILGPGARILLTGPNGAGKTTLLRLLLGRETPDGGSVRLAPGARIGYLPQDPAEADPRRTILDTYKEGLVGPESTLVASLLGNGLFRLEDLGKTLGQLSLGQRRKLEIARLVADGPNVLLLDEPTNYLSLDVLEAFEAATLAFPGPVIAVSHDRWLLERFGGVVWRLADGVVTMTDGLSG